MAHGKVLRGCLSLAGDDRNYCTVIVLTDRGITAELKFASGAKARLHAWVYGTAEAVP